MKAIAILENLSTYQELLSELQEREILALEEKEESVTFTKNISSTYSFITLDLYRLYKLSDEKELEKRLLCRVRFEIVKDAVLFKEVYHENAIEKEILTTLISENKKVNGITWRKTIENTFYRSDEITTCLNQADEIAAIAMNYASGDDYRPGFFSAISIEEEGIRLSQVNHMNAKSLNHKENYSLRNLEFFIPFEKKQDAKRRWQEYRLGEMSIQFSDGSSKNNKPCGEEIIKKIEALGGKQD